MMFSGILLILLLFAIVIPGRAQTTRPQETLDQYVADLQKSPENTALREKIIKLVLEMKPAPALPKEAERFMARGTAAVKGAKGADDFKDAVAEFEKATLAAPWLADAYYNLGVAQDKAGLYAQAMKSLKLYLLAAPDAPDANSVEELVYEIEYRQEKAAKEAEVKAKESSPEAIAAKKQAEFDAFLAKIDGRRYTYQRGHGMGPVAIDVRGKFLVTGQIDTRMANGEFHPGFEKWGPDPVAIRGFETTVPLPNPGFAPGIPYHTEATFIISEDGNSVTWRTRFSDGDTSEMVFLWQR